MTNIAACNERVKLGRHFYSPLNPAHNANHILHPVLMRLHTVRCTCNNDEKDDSHNNNNINNDNNDNNDNNNSSSSNGSIKNNFRHNSGNNDNSNIDNMSKNLGTDSNISRKVKNDLKKIPKIVPHESLAISTIAVQQSFSQAENFRKLWENYRWSSQLL